MPDGLAESEFGSDSSSNSSVKTVSLGDTLQFIKGVGPHLAATFAKLGLLTVGEVLRHIPRRWEDRTHFCLVAEARSGDMVTMQGTVMGVGSSQPRPGMRIIKAVLSDSDGGSFTLVWFNQPYLEKTFKSFQTRRSRVVVYGQAKVTGWTLEIQNPEWEAPSEDENALSANRIVPIYPSTEGLYQERIRRVVDSLLRSHLSCVDEALPPEVILGHSLVSAQDAIKNIHFPLGTAELTAARRRLVFEEFYCLQVLLALRRRANSYLRGGIKFVIDMDQIRRDIAEMVPFQLTGAQQRALEDIAADMGSGHAMNRLIQGDVGSGKTMVALGAMLMAVESGYQAVLMAPTEILAQQHAIVLRRLLEPLGHSVEIATGSLTAKEKSGVRDRLLSGQSRLAVGTHALIEEEVQFARLGLVIIDEQHRFGVLQRAALAKKGQRPHVLVMTATPIPRTLTMTLYGDLDVSVLNEMPPGRKPITTHWKPQSKRSQVYASAQRLLIEGRQVYVVCPLVEESEKLQAKSAVQLREHIANEVFPQYRVGLLHGQMKSDEKDQVMAQFKAHEIDVLVSTTVIEVGIDVPNASAIIIEDADRFGLAQLHQLRGRVGRGQYSSYCVLMAEPKTQVGRARLEVMTATQDGFLIAEEDLKIRGPGEFFGTKQSGIPELIFGDILRDQEILAETREAAFHIVAIDPELSKPEHLALRKALRRTELGFELIGVG